MDDVDLDPGRILKAVEVIDPRFQHSPQYEDDQLNDRLGRRVVLKDETANPLRCFKGRGAGYLVSQLPADRRVVCASSGNFGAAMAYMCRRSGIACSVFLRADANPVSRQRIEIFGGEIHSVDGDGTDLQEATRSYATGRTDCILVEDGRLPAIAEGAGTIGVELLETGPLDAVILPVGDGALVTGVACWLTHRAPATRVIGVCPASAPSVAESWRAGAPRRRPAHTLADGLSINEPIPESLERMGPLVDDMVLVSEAALVDAMRLAATSAGRLVEPSAAAGLAALLEHDLPGERVATVFTGAVPRPEHLALLATARP
jgi:threonine dehydratase